MRPRREDDFLYYAFIGTVAALVFVLAVHTFRFVACEVRDGTLGFDGTCIYPERNTP